jgi:hypothetical protein
MFILQMEQRLLFVSENIGGLFKDSHNLVFTEPVLDSINAIIVLNCIVKIANSRKQNTFESNINFETLKQIIDIKCKEYCKKDLNNPYQLNPTLEQVLSFTNDFYSYLDRVINQNSF